MGTDGRGKAPSTHIQASDVAQAWADWPEIIQTPKTAGCAIARRGGKKGGRIFNREILEILERKTGSF
jgi:hypothetical protein